jgi:hypothetical protein
MHAIRMSPFAQNTQLEQGQKAQKVRMAARAPGIMPAII